MMFCPKCGAIMFPKKEKNDTIFSCSCGYKNKSKETVELKEEVKTKKQDFEIIKDGEETLPETDVECPKCENSKAYFWMIQTRAGDEPETKFMRCTKCKHTWRDYS